jgi:hypothetical protein
VDEYGRQGAGGDGGVGEQLAEEPINKKQGQAGHFLLQVYAKSDRIEKIEPFWAS